MLMMCDGSPEVAATAVFDVSVFENILPHEAEAGLNGFTRISLL